MSFSKFLLAIAVSQPCLREKKEGERTGQVTRCAAYFCHVSKLLNYFNFVTQVK